MRILTSSIFFIFTAVLFAQDTNYVCHREDIMLFPLEDINTKSIEFSPTYYQNGLVFVVARERNSLIDPKTGQAYLDLMYADIGPDGMAHNSIFFSPNIRTQYHEGPCVFSQDGNEIYFTRSNISSGQAINDDKNQVQLKIYHGVKGAEDWEQITELPFNSDIYSVAHPALSSDGRYLVFSSNMPGSLGGMDLYVCERLGDAWSQPTNLGTHINSKGNEVFPYFHQDGYLFFSSDGRQGEGGLDLFVTSVSDDKTFKGLQHLTKPFNSSKDDLGLIVSADGRSGYFASDRKPTTGKDDLYRWSSPASIFCFPKTLIPVLFSRDMMVTNESGDPVEHAHVWIIPMDQEGPSMYRENFHTELVPMEDNENTYFIRWGVEDTLSTATADAISPPTGRVQLNANDKIKYALVVQHKNYSSYIQVLPGSEIPAYVRLKKLPEVTGKCLNTLFTVYNANGSAPVNGARITITGPCVVNTINVFTDPDGFVTACLPTGCQLKVEVQKDGYEIYTFSISPTEADEHFTVNLKAGISPSQIASGSVIILDNIYYDFNKSAIRKGDAEELNSLAIILKQYPDVTIELTSHTDTRGTAEYNMELSERRSESSKSYLVSRGVASSRIVTKAAGESSPRNHCTDGVPCTEAEHLYNRRTEVRIINPAQGMEVRYKNNGNQ